MYKNNLINALTITEITELFAKSQDPEELKHLWVEWHKEAGAKARHNFTEYVRLYNEAAKLNGKEIPEKE